LSYQVLARKWRPKSFAELMGQEHVVRALTGGLENGRLHHAFLFTGTRGVGKTTIARIIAKALNCEVGISATPCNQCGSCKDIDAGRFPDMLEIDAASRTKVDDTREILDNVMYAPSRGRFKVYLIDEVHMLSTSSFNALLKTLEEPPEHVKFLLATTDPQKLPVTVLSRCLKFHLKRLTISQIDQQMQHILQAENISFEAEAIDELARAADGSMRDGLSLLDQALAFGGGSVNAAPTREMLGTISRESVLDLLEALADASAEKLSEQLSALADFGGSYVQILARLMEYLHQLAFLQVVGESAKQINEISPRLKALSTRFSPEDLQIKFQFANLAAKEVASAPDAKIAFEMCLLRMLAFADVEDSGGTPVKSLGKPEAAAQTQTVSAAAASLIAAPAQPSALGKHDAQVAKSSMDIQSSQAPRNTIDTNGPHEPQSLESTTKMEPRLEGSDHEAVKSLSIAHIEQAVVVQSQQSNASENLQDRWQNLVKQLAITGAARELAFNALAKNWHQGVLQLTVDVVHSALKSADNVDALSKAIEAKIGQSLRIEVSVDDIDFTQSPAHAYAVQQNAKAKAFATALPSNVVVKALIEQLDARIIPSSVQYSGRA
jgi:DNA polymerase III subunit gamma/tau